MASSEAVNYPWPSVVNMANFVTMRPSLDRDNLQESIRDYKTWKEQMICLLESQDLMGFIDGKTPPPTPSDHGESTEKLWRRTDMLIKGWILGSVQGHALHAVAGSNTSKDVWLELEKIFNVRMKADSEDLKMHAAAGKDTNKYLPLYKAALRGDWKQGEEFLEEHKEGITAVLNCYSETLVHTAVHTGRSNDFLMNLLQIIPQDALEKKNACGQTALHVAAVVGNKEAAKMLVNKDPKLQYILNAQKFFPVHAAAVACHKETLEYLISVSEIDHLKKRSPLFVGKPAGMLLGALIVSGFVDLALDLVRKYPDMATQKDGLKRAPLQKIARMASLFRSGQSLRWWQNLIYYCISLEPPTSRKFTRDIEKSSSFDDGATKSSWLQFAYRVMSRKSTPDIEKSLSIHDRATKFSWTEVACKVPCVKRIKDKKVAHQKALELAKLFCERTASLPHSIAEPIYKEAIITAAHLGIHEVVEVIIETFPSAAFVCDPNTGSNIFLLAARERLENVFNLIYQMEDKKHFFFDAKDSSWNNFMHMCAEIAPPHKLNRVSGPALQMQRELQWFKEMEKFVNPCRRSWPNKDSLTPKMLFTKEHKNLKEQGEKWMKGTATSCTIAAALIATVVFSAAFTVPGNVNSNTGIPILLNTSPFLIFILADSVSLFTSTTSLLLFLSILTSRYAEEDFLYALPNRLCMGLVALFTSISFMMIAFSVAIYITLQNKSRSLIIPVALVASLPVGTFLFLQTPLLIAVMHSTYGPGIFGNKSGRTLY